MKPIRLFVTIFRTSRPLFLAAALSFLVLSVVVWFPQLTNAILVLGGDLPWLEKARFIGGIYASLFSTHSVVGVISIIALSMLFGLHGVLIVHYIKTSKRKGNINRYHALSTMGFIAGLLGVGCAACGSIILTTFAVSLGVGGIFLFLPWGGQELTFIGIGMLLISMYYLLKHMVRPQVCDIV